ncbi:hypothetical protein GMI70_00260 [Eggerthellaceae bacterium zg-893]|nr:hypothetical protein [Eggerthellaceae bacterium zg-893]
MDTRHPSGRSMITNCFAFATIMAENEDLCRGLIERVLGIEIECLDVVAVEADVPQITRRAVSCDVLARGAKTAFEVEMQVGTVKDLPRRARYIASLVDARVLAKGEPTHRLPDLFVIFICMHDPFERGLPRYTTRRCMVEDAAVACANGVTEVYVNATGDLRKASPELAALCRYFVACDTSSGDPFVAQMDGILERRLEDEEWRSEVLTLDQYLALERGEGIAIGEERGMTSTLERLVEAGLLTPAQAQEFRASQVCDNGVCAERRGA